MTFITCLLIILLILQLEINVFQVSEQRIGQRPFSHRELRKMSSETPRVLSIQSHVVHGYVGNKSATFPLQVLGFEVDLINSVQFSNHTGYKKCTGQILTEKDLDTLTEGLSFNGLDNYSYLLTGYNASVTMLQRITSLLQRLREVNPNLIYVCDPVMGDNGKFYVPQELLPIYQNHVIPLADIITPNQFELELLTECKINNIDDAWGAIQKLHEKGCKTVVISSTELGDEEYMIGLASRKTGEKAIVKIPKLPASFTGTGDLFAALFLAWMHKTGNKLKESLERTISTLQAVLRRTLQSIEGKEQSPQNMELKLIQSKHDIENPNIVVKAEYV